MRRIVIQRTGPHVFAYLPVAILVGPEEAKQARMVTALIDTGADHTVVRASVLAELGITMTGRSLEFTGAGASGDVGTAWLTLGFEGVNDTGDRAAMTNNKEIAVSHSLTEEMILGMDVLGCFDLSFQRSGKVELAWG